MLKLAKKHEQIKRVYSITSDTKMYLNEINLSTDNISENFSSTKKANQTKTKAKAKNINEVKKEWTD